MKKIFALSFILLCTSFAHAGESAKLAAKAGEMPITVAEVNGWLRIAGVDPAKATAKDWNACLNMLIDRAILIQAGEQARIKISRADVIKAHNEYLNGPNSAQFQARVKALGFDQQGEIEHVRQQLLIDWFLARKIRDGFVVTPAAMKKWHEEHKHTLGEPEVRTARVITIKETGDAGKKLIAELRRKIADGADFSEVAKTESKDPWAEKGGELPPMKVGESGNVFLDETLKLKGPKELSEVFETANGLHILQLEGITPATVPPFENVQEEVRKNLYNELRAQFIPKLIDELRKKSTIEIFINEPQN